MSQNTHSTILIAAFAVIAVVAILSIPAAAETTEIDVTQDRNATIENYSASTGDTLHIFAPGPEVSDLQMKTNLENNEAQFNITDGETEYFVSDIVSMDSQTGEFSLNISHDEFSSIPGSAGETAELTLFASNRQNNETQTGPIQLNVTFADSHSSIYMDDSAASTEEVEPGFFSLSTIPFFSLGEDNLTDLHTYEQTVGINGSQTDITVTDATSTGPNAFEDALGDEKSAGDLIYSASASIDGVPVLAFYDEANTDLVDESTTYAVYDSSSGTWTFNLGDEHADKSEVDVFVSSQSYTDVEDFSGEDLRNAFIEQADMSSLNVLTTFGIDTFGAFGFGIFNPLSMSGSGSLFAGLFVISRRRRPSA